ncbi:hypothetical protein GCM10025858_24020 [Alicyclobacillus sacchari]|nr:hypothetical protein GCM10025858_24020 [Alicyclobacillus sacchari]
MALFEFGLPELGEGLHEGRISKWLVKPGDQIQEDDAVAEIENDKSLVELPPRSVAGLRRSRYRKERRASSATLS